MQMPNAAEIIKDLSATLEDYRMFARLHGLKSDEEVRRRVEETLDNLEKEE